MSLFRPACIDLSGSDILYAGPAAIILAFPKAAIWGMMTALPVSATQCTMRCDIFSTNQDAKLDDVDMDSLKVRFQAIIRTLEQEYDAIKSLRPSEEPELLPTLKEHLKLERLAGMEVYPGRKEDNRSESFCKAEKSE